MANQTSTTSKRRASPPPKRSAKSTSTATAERDDTYGLISVIYHALQGADTIGKYIEDARAADNEELAAFFEECQGRQNELAMKGKRLLGAQLYETVGEDDEDESEDEDEDADE